MGSTRTDDDIPLTLPAVRAPREREVDYYRAVRSAIDEEKLQHVFTMLYEKAIDERSIAAAKCLLDFTIGRMKPPANGGSTFAPNIQAVIFKDTPPRGLIPEPQPPSS